MKKEMQPQDNIDADAELSEEYLFDTLSQHGINKADPRLKEMRGFLKSISNKKKGQKTFDSKHLAQITNANQILQRSLNKQHVIADFESFTAEVGEIYHRVKNIKTGIVASYIPQLARVNPDLFAISVCTVDGQVYSIGDTDASFSLQSCNKVVNYAIALEELGEQQVHQHVGKEPSGVSFNALSLDYQGLPHNPLINAGAIMCSSLIRSSLTPADKFDLILDYWEDLNGINRPTFNNSVYQSERITADRNYALAYFMRENDAFPKGVNLHEVLEFYFQCCSIESDTQMLSRVTATFANSGVNPFTRKRVFNSETVKHCLSMMYSCGMYDYSGEFAFSVGIPAKSGVSGVIWLAIPNVMGVCIYSPPLDKNGNSVKAIEFAKELVNRFNFHNYDSLNLGKESKIDPRRKKYETQSNELMNLIFAAAAGDLDEVKRLHSIGLNLDEADYDGRTAIHLAASEGHVTVIKYLITQNVEMNPKDRWGGTPLSDAKRGKHKEVIRLLEGKINQKVES